MKKYLVLCAIPPAFGLIHLASYPLINESWYPTFTYFEILFIKSLSLLGFIVAMANFERGEYLRKAWQYMAAAMLMYIFSDLIAKIPSVSHDSQLTVLLLRGLVIVMGNLFTVIGSWMLARTWHSAGLEFTSSKSKTRLMLLLTIALAVIFAGPGAYTGLKELISGSYDMWSIIKLASGLGDTFSLSLIAPMLLTALTLKGGLLRWPWIFLTSILCSWLVTDMCMYWGPKLFEISDQIFVFGSDFFRIHACMFGFAAGFAQHFVMTKIRSSKQR